VNARPATIATLDIMRDMLEDLGDGLGVTDPVSGAAILDIAPATSEPNRTECAPDGHPLEHDPSVLNR
jgi:hypothetical protein